MKKKFIFDSKDKKLKRRYRLSEALADLSFGAINKMCDLFLVMLLLGEASISSGGLSRKFALDAARLLEAYPGTDIKNWIAGFRTVRKKRWVDANLSLTEEGRKKLAGIVPTMYQNRHWDKIWHFVIFDIPENLTRKRDALREKLRILGFGKLQGSVWISPFNLLGTVQNELEKLELEQFVVCAQTTTLGEGDSKELAMRVWKIDDLGQRYKEFLEQIATKKLQNPHKIFFRYLDIIRQDPQLPSELLPKDWAGNEAHKYMSHFLAQRKGNADIGYDID